MKEFALLFVGGAYNIIATTDVAREIWTTDSGPYTLEDAQILIEGRRANAAR